jgi:predicted DNA-binding transcriptional regulator AlpA
MERLMSIEDLAQRWGVSKAYVYQLSAASLIPKVKLSHGVVRFREKDVSQYEIEHFHESRHQVVV